MMSEVVRVKPLNRVFAKFFDLSIVMLVAAGVIYPVGPLLGFLYSLFADGLPIRGFSGKSFGKRMFKLKVVSIKDGRSGNWKDSLLRNAPVGIATFFALIPIWGWAILALIGFPLMIIEIYLLIKAPHGQRLGDVMADTEVVSVAP
jgi:uncharacterized RDD family membrane protein YckC